jgi:hypothetical protein
MPMSQHTDLLQHDAQLILSLFGDAKAQRLRLLAIEKQLKAEGVNIQMLHQNIAGLNQVADPEEYRCRYQPF